MKANEGVEIPFGAKDSELKGWEYTIPEGMEARIKDGKIIVRVKEVDLEKEATIKGYIARDLDGTLRFCYHKPRRENEIEKTWWGSCDADFDIYDDTLDSLFKDLTWDDEPVEVELTIKRL